MSVDYVDAVLQPGEKVTFRGKLSWTTYIPYVAIGLIVLNGPIRDLFFEPEKSLILRSPPFAVAFALILILSFLIPFIKRKLTLIAATDRRVILKVGIIFRRSIEMNMDKIESVEIEQTVFGRLCNSGTVIIRGTGGRKEGFAYIDSPLEFRSHVIAK